MRAKFLQTMKSLKELLKATKDAAHEELAKTAPKVVHLLDKSLDEAGATLSDVMTSIEKRTVKEQLQLLKVYRAVLNKQMELIDERTDSLLRAEEKARA